MNPYQDLKMRIVLDRSLSPGSHIAQALHALQEFSVEYPDLIKEWYISNNSVVALNASSEQLVELINKCNELGLAYSIFREPDFDYMLTAVALQPCRLSRKLTSNFSLALRGL